MSNRMLLWLFAKLLFMGTMFFAAGAVADPVVSGGDDGAALDDAAAAAEPTGDDPDPAAGGSGDDPAADPNAKPPVIDGKPDDKLDGRTMPAKVRETLDALKTADPAAHTWIKDRLWAERNFRQEFPGGLAEAKKAKEEVALFTKEFPAGIQGVKQELGEWNNIDQLYNAGDPKFIDIMHDANPESFAKVMPNAISKFAQVDGPGYQRYMCSLFHTTLQNSGILSNLKFLERATALGDKEGAAGILKEIGDWAASLDATAKSKPEPKTANPQNDQRATELEERESKLWANEVASRVNPERERQIRTLAKQYIPKGVEMDGEDYEALDRLVQGYMDAELRADPEFVKTFSAYAEAKDTPGIEQFMKTKLAAILASQPARNGKPAKMGPVERAVKRLFRGATPAPKVAPKAAAKPGQQQAAPPQGWTKVAAAPKESEIDLKASPFEMRFKEGAVLKNGKKVFWGGAAPA